MTQIDTNKQPFTTHNFRTSDQQDHVINTKTQSKETRARAFSFFLFQGLRGSSPAVAASSIQRRMSGKGVVLLEAD
jgi:hypothetical protein